MADIDWDELMEEAEVEEQIANDSAIAAALHEDEVRAADEERAVALVNDGAVTQAIAMEEDDEEEAEEEEDEAMEEEEDQVVEVVIIDDDDA